MARNQERRIFQRNRCAKYLHRATSERLPATLTVQQIAGGNNGPEQLAGIPVIDAIITAVRNGELDEAVKALDRPRFKKKAA